MAITGDGTTTGGHLIPQHVWVAPDGHWHHRCVGIVLEQRRSEDGWEVRVTWAAGGGNVTVTQHSSWLSAALVRRLDEMK